MGRGYKARFGLIHVDFATQLRTIKNSGYWFRDWLSGKYKYSCDGRAKID